MLEPIPLEKTRHCVFESCKEDALAQCHKCGKWYCLDHASELDPVQYCRECLRAADITLEQAPLLDEDGVRHSGRVIRPVGVVFSQNGKLIHEMSDDELKEYIKHYQQAVHDCERSLDYARITLGNSLFEAGHREIAKVQKQSGEIVFISRKPVAPAKQRKSKQTPVDEDKLVEFLMKSLTPEQLTKFLAKTKKGV